MDDPTNYDALKFWLDVAQWVFTVGVMVFVWIDRGRSDNRGLIKQLHDRHDALERRLITAEEGLKRAPTHDDISALREEQASTRATVERMASSVDRIHDYLMNNK